MQAILDEVMDQLLFMDGTLWEAAPPPTGLRPVVLDLIHTLVAVQASVPAAFRLIGTHMAASCSCAIGKVAPFTPLLCFAVLSRGFIRQLCHNTRLPVERVISILLGVHLWLHCACTAPQTELAAMAPALLAEAMEELLLGMLDGWAQASRATGGGL